MLLTTGYTMIRAFVSGFADGVTKAYKTFFSNKKKLTILGESGVGKTTFIKYLKGKTEKEALETTQTINSEKESIKIDKVSFDIVDMGGSKTNYKSWVKQVKDTDYLLYFFNISSIFKKDTDYRIKDDMKQINEYIYNSKNIKKVFIIGTHCDKAKDCDNDQFYQKIIDSKIYKIMLANLGGSDMVCTIFGSLNSTKNFNKISDTVIKVINDEE